MSSFKYPCLYLGDRIITKNKIKSGLTLLQDFRVGTWKDSSGTANDISALLYADMDKDFGADLYIIILDYANYMFTFSILEDAMDCINDFRTTDVHATVTQMNNKRYDHQEVVESCSAILEPLVRKIDQYVTMLPFDFEKLCKDTPLAGHLEPLKDYLIDPDDPKSLVFAEIRFNEIGEPFYYIYLEHFQRLYSCDTIEELAALMAEFKAFLQEDLNKRSVGQ